MASDPGDPVGAEGAPPPRKVRWGRHAARTLLWSIAAVVVLAFGSVVFLTRTGPGVRLVMGRVLDRLEGSLQGTIRVEEVESPDLLEGALLRGVEVRDADGRTVLSVDSLRVDYSIMALLAGDVVLDRVDARGLTVDVERLPGQEGVNLSRIFQGGSPQLDTALSQPSPGRRRRILLRNVTVSRGELRIRLPAGDPDSLPPGAYTARGPGGGLLRQYDFRRIQADLPRVAVSMPGQEGESYHISHLAMTAEIQREPVRLEELQGDVRLVGSRVEADGLRVALPASRARGKVSVDWSAEGTVVDATLRADPLALTELRWLLPDLPAARVTGPLELRMDPDSTVLSATGAELRTDRSTLQASGALRVAPDLAFRNLDVRLTPLALPDLRPWVGDSLPARGDLTGSVHLDGGLDRLAVKGDADVDEEGMRPTTARFSGTVDLGGGRAVQGLHVEADPLDFAWIGRFFPGRTVPGTGWAVIDADGSLSGGMRVSLELQQRAPGLSVSRLETHGTVRVDSTDVYVDLDGDVDPLDLGVVHALEPGVALEGPVEGPVRLTGRLGDLHLHTELTAEDGSLTADARFDARHPDSAYELDGQARDLRLSDLVSSLPAPTVLSGSVRARGRGSDRETLQGEASVSVRNLRVARFTADSASLALRVQGGTLQVDSLEARTSVARFSGSGRIGLSKESPPGTLSLTFRNDSIETMRPLLLGDTVIAVDTLSPLEREALVVRGVNPDTLPTAASVRLTGAVSGRMTLTGRVDALSADGTVSVRDLAYGPNFVRQASLGFSASGLPGLDGEFKGTLRSDSVRWFGRSFAGGNVDFDYTRPSGTATVELRRSEEEDYRARAAFETDSLGGVVHLDELVLRFEPVRWNLGGPATLEWSSKGIHIRDFRLIRPGLEGMRIRADGTLPFKGDANFDLEIRRMSLGRVTDLLQSRDSIAGLVDLDLHVGGTAASPVATGNLAADSLRFRNVSLSRLESRIDYADRRARGTLDAWRDGRPAAHVQGVFPLNLTFGDVDRRVPDEPMDLTARVDSFPVAVLTTVVSAMEDVNGTVSGQVRFQGTPSDVQAGGSFRLQKGAFSLPDLGIRPVDVSGTVTLMEGDQARVDLEGRSVGTLQVKGTMGLSKLTNPTLDLAIDASGFQAVNRRDLQGRIGGEVTLKGTYERPVVSGSAQVDAGTLRIEELERSAEVVDLSDPRFFDVVDTSLVSVEPVLQESRNPFLQNLQVDVDLQVRRSSLRSREMNVEMGGDLTINWNRTTGDLVLTGQLSAIRGTYTAFDRQFQVSEGGVEFVGTPGLNPNLDIQADTRLRTVQGEPLTITAAVTGTLLEPRVSLSSDAQPPIAESDLVSYLIFGRPSFALASGETAVLQQRLLGAGATLGLGTVASQLGSVVQNAGVDYFAVTQAPGAGQPGGGLGSTVASTQVEAGWYLKQNIFLSFLFRPLVGVGGPSASTAQDRLAGVRVEWQLGDVWTIQAFWEDRFNREPIAGFGELPYHLNKTLGFQLYRDWGY